MKKWSLLFAARSFSDFLLESTRVADALPAPVSVSLALLSFSFRRVPLDG